MLVDANVLLYSVDEDSPFHDRARVWVVEALNGPIRVGLPWQSLWAFLRIVTNPRAVATPLSPGEAWEHVDDWLAAPASWSPLRVEDTASCSGRSWWAKIYVPAWSVTLCSRRSVSSTGSPS